MKEQAGLQRSATGSPLERRPQLLIVDDEPETCALLHQILERAGYAVTTELTARRALQRLSKSTYDLVVSDVTMPETDGIALCEQMGALRPELPVLLLTGHADVATVTRALRAGARDFLSKPLDINALLATVNHLLAARSASSGPAGKIRRRATALGVTALLGESPAIQGVRSLIVDLRDSVASVLIQGETGTGKELIAQALHATSRLGSGPFVAINCAAMPASLLESELFGHAKGAFTEATTAKKGLLVEANGGTLLLDEIADLPLALQPKLLRALQERSVRPLGEYHEVPFDCRLLSAANQDLERAVKAKRFREDLFYRLDVVRIAVPPLRERGVDVLLLARYFLDRFARAANRVVTLTDAAALKLLAHDWPGNVRELENCMERALALTRADEITVEDLPENVRLCSARSVPGSEPASQAEVTANSLFEAERSHVLRIVRQQGGNKTRAAEVLGMDRRTLYRKLRRYEIRSRSKD